MEVETVKVYKASDGLTFNSEVECRNYEERLEYRRQIESSVNKCKLKIKMNDCDVYKINNETDYLNIIKNLLSRGCADYVFDRRFYPDDQYYWFEMVNGNYQQHSSKKWVYQNKQALDLFMN